MTSLKQSSAFFPRDCLRVYSGILKVCLARDVDEEVEDRFQHEPSFDEAGDSEWVVNKKGDRRINDTQGCNEMQESYTSSDEDVIPGGCPYHRVEAVTKSTLGTG